jgi:uncharacterized protein (DUF1015 family)
MIAEGWLARDEVASYYVYRLRSGGHVQTGVVGAAAVDDYLAGRVKKHELTRPDKERDRTRLGEALSAHPGPVFLMHRPHPSLTALVAEVTARPPSVSFVAVDGVGHELWVVGEPATSRRIEEAFAGLPCTYVADGHHRAAAAAAVCRHRREGLAAPTGREPCNFFLAAHFPADELRVLDYNRVISDLGGLTPETLVERVRAAGFDVAAGATAGRPPRRGTFGMYVAGAWHLLSAPSRLVPDRDPLGALDVSILTRHILQPVLGIEDPRTDPRIDFVGGIRGTDELVARVRSGRAAVAFSLYPTGLEDVMLVADGGGVMPPKSTWFEPKLRSGMVVLSLEGDEL